MKNNLLMNKSKLVYLFAVCYMISYITRINFGGIISEMVEETGISKSLLSLSITGSFITYGTGQIVSGFLGDRFSPKRLIMVGFFLTLLMNILLPAFPDPYYMMIIWSINGFAQAFMWPPLVKIMAGIYNDEEYKKANVTVSWGSSAGTILVYMCSPFIISFFGWKYVFYTSAFAGVLMILIWNKYCPDIETKKESENINYDDKNARLLSPVIFGIMFAIILQGILRDGITTWMPTYIAETYNLGSEISILSGVIIPVFSMGVFRLSSYIYREKIKNPLKCAGVIFLVGTVSAVFLSFISGMAAGLSVVFSAVTTGAMHGVNLMLVCMVPGCFKNKSNISTISGVLNFCTYVGSAISTYGVAVISEKLGWSVTVFIWAIISMTGTIICFVCTKPWEKYSKMNLKAGKKNEF